MSNMQIPANVSLDEIPLRMPPDGLHSNFVDPPSWEQPVVALSYTVIILTFILAIVRIWMNVFKLRKPGWDDGCFLVGLVFAYWYCGANIRYAKFYRHMWDIPVSWVSYTFAKEASFVNISTYLTLLFTKTAIFGLFLQIFAIHPHAKWLSWTGIVIAFLAYFPSIPATAHYCIPKGDTWMTTYETGCDRMMPLIIAQACVTVLLDVVIFAIPMPILWKLKMSKGKKAGIVAVFATAILGVVAATLTLHTRVKFWQLSTFDSLWWGGKVQMFAVIEIGVTIVVACIPSLAAFLKAYVGDTPQFQSLWSKVSRTSSSISSRREKDVRASNPHAAGFGILMNTTVDVESIVERPEQSHFDLHRIPSQSSKVRLTADYGFERAPPPR